MENQNRIPLSNSLANMRRLTPNRKLQEFWQKLEDDGLKTLEDVLIWIVRHPGDSVRYPGSGHDVLKSLGPCHYYTRYALWEQLAECGWSPGGNLLASIKGAMVQEIKKKLKEAEES